MRRLQRFLRSVLAGTDRGSRSAAGSFARQSDAYSRSLVTLRMFYGGALFFSAFVVQRWPALRKATDFDPLWPIAWIESVGIGPGIDVICAFHLVTAFVVALSPGRRLARVFYAVGLLEFFAVVHSVGPPSHGAHAWIWTSLLLTLLPTVDSTGLAVRRAERQTVVWMVASAQVFLLLFYSMSGVWKVAGAIEQLWIGETSALAPSALARTILARTPGAGGNPVLASFLAQHPWAGWLPYLGILYLELFAIVAAFRPALHRLWGFALIAFHMATGLAMGIFFLESVLLHLILLVGSPFAPRRVVVGEVVASLPLFGVLARWAPIRPRPARISA